MPDPSRERAKETADELYAALRAAHVPPPYVLVATSFGAFDVRIFAHDHPNEVAAMVLLNPAHEDEELQPASAPIEKIDRDGLDHARTCLRGARDGMLGPGKPLNKTRVPPPMPAYPQSLNDTRTAQLEKPKFWSALVSEWTHIRTSAAQVKALDGRLGGLPLVVVSGEERGHQRTAAGRHARARDVGAPPTPVRITQSNFHSVVSR